jgi:hypothetical protein
MTEYVVLDEEAFRQMVSGGVVKTRSRSGVEIHIILSDIGFNQMARAIENAVQDAKRSN